MQTICKTICKQPDLKKNITMDEPQVFKLLAILSPLACEVSDVKENISHLVSIVVTIIAMMPLVIQTIY